MMPVELICIRNMMVRNFQMLSFNAHLQTPNGNEALLDRKAMAFIML